MDAEIAKVLIDVGNHVTAANITLVNNVSTFRNCSHYIVKICLSLFKAFMKLPGHAMNLGAVSPLSVTLANGKPIVNVIRINGIKCNNN